MCKYFTRGRCTRQPCDFAHSVDELQPTPNLSCTKVCPTLLRTGRCDDPTCAFAHKRNELRRLPVTASGRPSACDGQAAAQTDAAGNGAFSRQTTPGDYPSYTTFLEAEGTFSRHTTPGDLWFHGGTLNDAHKGGGSGQQTSSDDGNYEEQSSMGTQSECELAAGILGQGAGGKNRFSPKFHKTTLCAFHQQGKCKRGAACHFAHGELELQPLPNLYRTKLCPRLLSSGTCPDPDCRYAHNREELRKIPAWAASYVGEGADSEDPPVSEMPAPDLASEDALDGSLMAEKATTAVRLDADALSRVEVRVKNTFLTVDELPDMSPPPIPRTRTMPNLTAQDCSNDGAEDDGTRSSVSERESRARDEAGSQEGSRSETTASPTARNAWGESADLVVMQEEEGVWVHVKNTFLTIDEPPTVQLPPRSRTQPNLLALGDSGGESPLAGVSDGTWGTPLQSPAMLGLEPRDAALRRVALQQEDSLPQLPPSEKLLGDNVPIGPETEVDSPEPEREPDSFLVAAAVAGQIAR